MRRISYAPRVRSWGPLAINRASSQARGLRWWYPLTHINPNSTGNDPGTPRYFYGHLAIDTAVDYSTPGGALPVRVEDSEWGVAWQFAAAASGKGNFFEHYSGGPPLLPNACNTVTMCAWFTADSVAAYHAICGQRTASGQLLIYTGGGAGNPLTFAWNSTPAEYDASSGLTLTIGRRYFGGVVITPTNAMVFTWDDVAGWRQYDLAATYNGYVDTTASDNFIIGGDNAGGVGSAAAAGAWNGLIAEVRIYDRSLSKHELQRMATAERWNLYAAPRRIWLDRLASASAGNRRRRFFLGAA